MIGMTSPKKIILLSLCLLTQGVYGESLPLNFEAANERLLLNSDSLKAAAQKVHSKQQLATATRALRHPEVSIDVRQMKFEKSLSIPLGEFSAITTPLGLGDHLDLKEMDWRTRPIVTATLPLYTGGRTDAALQAALADVKDAEGESLQSRQSLQVELVNAYYGQQLTAWVVSIRAEVLAGLEQHLQHAKRLEQEGFASRAQRLQAEVAKDQAERDYYLAANELKATQAALAGLLYSELPIATQSPLFVITGDIEPLAYFKEMALTHQPGLTRLRAKGEQARQKVRVEEAEFKPSLYAFGQYDLKPEDALITESDWVFGIGVKYTLLSNRDRLRQIGAAEAQALQVDYALQDTKVRLQIGVEKAYHQLESARQQYLLSHSAIAQTEENLRLQTLSFREGQSTSLDVIDARLQLGQAQTERALAAFKFDTALAELLSIAGITEQFIHYQQRADHELPL